MKRWGSDVLNPPPQAVTAGVIKERAVATLHEIAAKLAIGKRQRLVDRIVNTAPRRFRIGCADDPAVDDIETRDRIGPAAKSEDANGATAANRERASARSR